MAGMKAALFRPLQLILILAVVGITTQYRTNIRIHGNVTCERDQRWCTRMVLMEYDSFKMLHDKVEEYGVKCTTGSFVPYEMNGKQEGDGLLDNFYELHMWIFHSCAENGNIWKQEHKLNLIPVSTTNVNLQQDYATTNKAVGVKSFFDDDENI
ncbi:hypothetical protein GCK72_022328 [Caenorhabditis remanei]|uniref:Uncharacterized protein n=1 Tax=Caenorhabditis remanei TaxID=31234 RepID=A0A6A5FU25_CAERE|nr:hypothetical protein GCK72_022328 [Caenorhabditis remanei]KAF1745881.1 hypothetical protein GCK72_022328 [Caenorhabditis remanei]